jgi:hypothetical protein
MLQPIKSLKNKHYFVVLVLSILVLSTIGVSEGKLIEDEDEGKESRNKLDRRDNNKKINNIGNNSSNAFLQVPHSNPPVVRPPPYTISQEKCPGKSISMKCCKFMYVESMPCSNMYGCQFFFH